MANGYRQIREYLASETTRSQLRAMTQFALESEPNSDLNRLLEELDHVETARNGQSTQPAQNQEPVDKAALSGEPDPQSGERLGYQR